MTTTQAPLNSGFGATTTAREAIGTVRLDGKLAVVTGGYAGIGLETTRVLSAAGATVVVPARSVEKAKSALAGIANVEVDAMDLIDPASVSAFTKRFNASGRAVHLLINNAGIMASPLEREARGFDAQFATNHLGHFQLAVQLWSALQKAHGARVIALSSRGHRRSPVIFDDVKLEKRPYDKWEAYGQSKTANVLFAVAADKRGERDGIRAFAVHPGGIVTELMRHMPEAERQGLIKAAEAIEPLKTVEQGAATSVWCATAKALDGKGGVYCEDGDIAVLVPNDHKGIRGVRPYALDPALAERLWRLSEEWTGVRA